MLTSNTKYTALEILTEAGVEDAETKFGSMRVRIGGLRAASPDHVIRIQSGVESLDVIVGNELTTLEVSAPAEE